MPLTRSSCFYVSSLFFLVAVTGKDAHTLHTFYVFQVKAQILKHQTLPPNNNNC